MSEFPVAIQALVTLKTDSLPAVGRDRIRLLETVAREGSISAGARAIGITYKAAWDGLDAMANLFGKPLLAARTGGKAGGGAELTPFGQRLIEAFRRMEAEMARALRAIEPDLAETGVTPLDLVTGLLMKTSARNALSGIVSNVASDALSAEVSVGVSDATTIHALVTHTSLEDLGLYVGRPVTLLIKAPFVAIATGMTPPATSARNCIAGVITRCEISGVSAEVVLDIGGGKTLASTITAKSAQMLGLKPGLNAYALFDAVHVILAIN